MQYSCQRNYAILSTDGYWNTDSETATYGPFQLTTNTSVGQQDGAEAKPMHDGAFAIDDDHHDVGRAAGTGGDHQPNHDCRPRGTRTRSASTLGSLRWQYQPLRHVESAADGLADDRHDDHRGAEPHDDTMRTVVTTNGVVTSDSTAPATVTITPVSTSTTRRRW